MAIENRIYRVRIEAYDPDTEESEVILAEDEDAGYTKFLFLGEEIGESLRSIAMHVSSFDAAAMIHSEPILRRAAMLSTMAELSKKGESECPQ